MPSKSPAQARLMQAAAHDPQFAQRVGIPSSTAQEFASADKGAKIAQAIRAIKPVQKPVTPPGMQGGGMEP